MQAQIDGSLKIIEDSHPVYVILITQRDGKTIKFVTNSGDNREMKKGHFAGAIEGMIELDNITLPAGSTINVEVKARWFKLPRIGLPSTVVPIQLSRIET